MKILAVIITAPDTRQSGGFTAGLFLSQAIAEKVDIKVAVMAERPSEEIRGRLHVRYFTSNSASGPLSPWLPRQLRSVLWRNRQLSAFITSYVPDIVHFHNPHPSGALWQMAQTCMAEGIPYVISGHGFVEMSDISFALRAPWWKRPFLQILITRPFKLAVKNATSVLLTSPFEAPIVSDLGVAVERQFLVTNGVSPFYLQASDEGVCRTVKARWGISRKITSFLFVGNHSPNKGIDVLLAAAHKIELPIKIIISGRISSRTEHLSLLRKCRVNDLGERVVFTDTVSDEELRALYQSVDAFIFPTRADTLPTVVLEAMASGLPVIATRVGGIQYQITEETGIMIPPDDPASLVKAMTELANDAERRKRMGMAGRERVMANFDWSRSADTAIGVYRKSLEGFSKLK